MAKYIMFVLLTACSALAFSFNDPIPTNKIDIQVLRTNESITIDGKLDEQIWHRPGYEGLVQCDPDEYKLPTQKSAVWFDGLPATPATIARSKR